MGRRRECACLGPGRATPSAVAKSTCWSSSKYDPDDVYALQRQLYVRLLRALNGRPVDVLVVGPHTLRQPVHEEALREGVVL